MSDLETHMPEDVVLTVLTFLAVQGRLMWLRTQTALLSARINSVCRQMESDAAEARTLKEMSGAAEVAPVFLAQIEEVAAMLLGVSEAAAAVVSAADAASAAADDTHGEHQAEYRGIYEQAQASAHPMAKPGFYENR